MYMSVCVYKRFKNFIHCIFYASNSFTIKIFALEAVGIC